MPITPDVPSNATNARGQIVDSLIGLPDQIKIGSAEASNQNISVSVHPRSMEELPSKSDVVVIGTFISHETHESPSGRSLYTIAELQIDDLLRDRTGRLSMGQKLPVLFLGGSATLSSGSIVSLGIPLNEDPPALDHRYLVFLHFNQAGFGQNAKVSVYIDTSASGLNSVDEPQIEQILKNWSGILGVTLTPIKSPSGPPTNKTGTKTNPIWIISASPNVPSGFDALTSSFYPADGTYQDTSVSTLFQSSWLAPATATAVEDLMGHEIVHAFGEGECVATANATCSGVAANLLTAFVRKADEGTVGRLIVEAIILLSVRTQADGDKALRAAAQVYGVDTEAITLKVKQEFAAKDKARKASKPEPNATVKAKRLA